MHIKNSIPRIGVFAGLLVAGVASADVSFTQSVTVEAGGALAMMGSSGTQTTIVSGQKAYSESNMVPKSKLMASMAKDLETSSISRLDRGLMWQLQPAKQRYSEMSFEAMRAQMEKQMSQLQEAQGDSGGGLPVSDDDCQWSEPTIDIRQTGEKARIAGEKAEQQIIEVKQTCTVPGEDKSCDMTWTVESWMAKSIKGEDEIRAFQSELSEQLGVDEAAARLGGMAAAMIALYGDGFDQAAIKSKTLKGFPVKTRMALEIGGERCTMPNGQQIASDEIWSNAANAAGDAALGSAAGIAGSEAGSAAANAAGNSVGGRIAGSALGAASREVIGGLFGKMKKKKDQPKEEAPVAQNSASTAAGSVVVFNITTEITEIDTASIPGSRFEVPEGWKKVDSIY